MGNDINNEDEIHTFDLIIQETGGFGRFQQMILVLSLISSVLAACNHLSPIYLTYTPCFDCIDNLDLNGSDFHCKENYQVRLPKNLIFKKYRDLNFFQCPSSQDVQICNQWKYDSSIFESTVVTEFDLVCNRAQLLPTIASSYMIGVSKVILSREKYIKTAIKFQIRHKYLTSIYFPQKFKFFFSHFNNLFQPVYEFKNSNFGRKNVDVKISCQF